MMLPNVGLPLQPCVSNIELNLTDRMLKVWRCA